MKNKLDFFQTFKLRDQLFLLFVFLREFALLFFGLKISSFLREIFPAIDAEALSIATPVAVGPIIIQVTLGSALLVEFLILMLIALIPFGSGLLAFPATLLVASFCSYLILRTCSRRSSFLRSGLWIAALLVPTLCTLMLFRGAWDSELLFLGICGALLSGVVASGIAPVAEALSGHVTDIRLLELASLEQPLLKMLSVQAPGTCTHSMMVGQLTESACEAIGARALLAKVGAYYHDIGKVKNPRFFIENITSDKNPHDSLTPLMSATIIRAHIKDGIELAEEGKLPKELIDFIPQHHGTSMIEYFYDRAIKEAGDGDMIDEQAYRYHGPKPQSKEAAILMIADVLEASSRRLTEPNPARIQALVQKTINRTFVSGQLDESDLTLRDLHKIGVALSRSLLGIFHSRIDYPENSIEDTADKDEESDWGDAERDILKEEAGRIENESRRSSSFSEPEDETIPCFIRGRSTTVVRETPRRLGVLTGGAQRLYHPRSRNS
jgi:cyclic-di-AMP phosphodiesterase PgpH